MSEVKVNKLSPRSGTTVTLGDSGDTISIPSGVTLTSFTSTGIDDNATSTAITIDSSQNVSFAEDISTGNNGVLNILDGDGDISGKLANQSSSAHSLEIIADPSNSGANSNMIFKIDNTERMRIDDSGNVGIGNTVASTINSANGTGNLVVGSGSGTEGITIYSGTTGEGTLQFADGTSGSATYVGQINYNHSSNDMSFTAGGTERLRLLGTGNVGIGTSSPGVKLEIKGADGDADAQAIRLMENSTQGGFIKYDGNVNELQLGGFNSGENTGIRIARNDATTHFNTNGAETMRLTDGKARLLHGDFAATPSSSNKGFEFRPNGSNGGTLDCAITTTGIHTIINFDNGNGGVGTIQMNGSATAYNTSSDYRLKENVNYDFDATSRLKQLKPARFNFKADADTIVDGFIAHEVSSVVPEAISGEKDAIKIWKEGEELPEGVSVGDNKLDENGNTIIDAQGIDQSKLVPLLVKTIQELEARITALEADNL
jgi:hypothetical protein